MSEYNFNKDFEQYSKNIRETIQPLVNIKERFASFNLPLIKLHIF